MAGRFDALKERPFRLLFLGQAVSLLGDGMVGVALAFAVGAWLPASARTRWIVPPSKSA